MGRSRPDIGDTEVGPQRSSRPTRRRLRDRIVGGAARLLARGFFRSVEVEGTPPTQGPVILAASHLNGFVDPVLLVSKLRMFPRFLAKATLWKVSAARGPLNFLGVIPVHRRIDGAATGDNVGTFDSAVAALADGAVVALFPEGTTHDDPSIKEIRTGVSRIAIEAVASGVADCTIIPVGVSYEDKVSSRGRAIVHFGAPVSVPIDRPLLDDRREPNPATVRALTDEVQAAIEAVTPTFASTDDFLALESAAQIALRGTSGDDRPVPMARSAALSRKLAGAEPEQTRTLVDLVARYHMRLGFVRLRDEDLMGNGLARVIRRVTWLALLFVLLAPLALAGVFMNLLPVTLVVLAGMAPKAPVTKGTVRVLTAVVTFPVVWVLIAFLDSGGGWLGLLSRDISAPANVVLGSGAADRSGVAAAVVVLLLAPIAGFIAVFLAERTWFLLRGLRSWWTFASRRGQLDEIRFLREQVVDTVQQIVDDAR